MTRTIGYLWDEAFAVHVHTLNNICSNNEGIACSVNADCAGVGGKCGFAGKRDWRLPNVKGAAELRQLWERPGAAG